MVSIIIVNYQVKKELLACVASIYASKPKGAFEIIVVDNDEKKSIEKELKKTYPKVVYRKNENKGFGEGCNVGAKQARGEYLFFLNPDTEVHPGVIDSLVYFLQKNRNAGIVAPLLIGTDGAAYQQGTQILNPLRAIFSLSFFHKLFPNNPIARKYFLSGWDRKTTKEVDVAPGTAFMIKKDLFEEVGGFDENFFLFFEEFDLCKRIKELGYTIFIYHKARISHAWGVSTKKRSDIQEIFEKSRYYYFRKHFGVLSSVFTEAVLRFGKYASFLLVIASVGLFLRLHHLQESMTFIGDQGWFYISARDMIQTGNIPLVGIASSHPWLHQGALWTYMLAYGLWLMAYSPFAGAYVSIFLGLLGILAMYWLGKMMFSRRVGLIAAALFATSPLIIASDRMPYHTSPIPLFTILYIYCLHRWVKGDARFFPLVIAVLGILYNLELATALLGIMTMVVWLYGYMAKEVWARGVLSFKFLVLSLIAYAITMLPMLIYDVGHGFPQTLGFVAWLGYKVLLLFGYPPINPSTPVSWGEMGMFSMETVKKLLFPYSGLVAGGMFIGSLVYAFGSFPAKKPHPNPLLKGEGTPVIILLILNITLIIGFLAAKTPSHAYIPMMFPGMILLIAAAIGHQVIKSSSHQVQSGIFLHLKSYILYLILVGVICCNGYYSYQVHASASYFTDRMDVARYIVKEAGGKEYNLKGEGAASEFESFTMNYEYLAWWLGNGPSDKPQKLEFVISEEKGIRVEKQE